MKKFNIMMMHIFWFHHYAGKDEFYFLNAIVSNRFLNKLDDNCRSETNFSLYVNYAQIPTSALYSSCRFLCIELRPIMSYTRKITDITAIKRNYFSQPTVLVSVYFLCHKNCSFLYIIITTGIHIIIALLCIVQIQTG